MEESQRFPLLILTLGKEENEDSEESDRYMFVASAHYTCDDYIAIGGIRDDLSEAAHLLSLAARKSFDGMVSTGRNPERIEVLIARDLPNLESLYQKITFPLGLDDYGGPIFTSPSSIN